MSANKSAAGRVQEGSLCDIFWMGFNNGVLTSIASADNAQNIFGGAERRRNLISYVLRVSFTQIADEP